MWNIKTLPLCRPLYRPPFVLYFCLLYYVYIHLKSHQTMLYICFIFSHQTYFKEHNRRINMRKIVYHIYQIFTISATLPLFLMFQVSFCSYLPSVWRTSFSNLLLQVSWQQFLLAFLHLRMSLFYLHSWRIFPLKNSELRVLCFQNFKMLFHYRLAFVVSDEKSAVIWIIVPL